MNVRLDSLVLDREGSSLGTVDKVIFEPYRRELLALVVHPGRLHGPRRVLPLGQVRHAGDGSEIRTALSAPEFRQLEVFSEGGVRRPAGSWQAPFGWRAGRVRWPFAHAHYPAAPPPPGRSESGPFESTAGEMDGQCGCGLLHDERNETEPHRFQVDPYDVLNGPVVACCRTPYEWGEASNINPLPDPSAAPHLAEGSAATFHASASIESLPGHGTDDAGGTGVPS